VVGFTGAMWCLITSIVSLISVHVILHLPLTLTLTLTLTHARALTHALQVGTL